MRTEISTLFELPPAPRRAGSTHSRDIPLSGAASQLGTNITAPALTTPSVPVSFKAQPIAPGQAAPGRAQRVFKNITELADTSLFDGATPAVKPAPAVESTPAVKPAPVVEPTPVVEPAPAVEPTPAERPHAIAPATPTNIQPAFEEALFYDVPDDLFTPAFEADPAPLRARLREKLAQDKLDPKRAQPHDSEATRTALLPRSSESEIPQLPAEPSGQASTSAVLSESQSIFDDFLTTNGEALRTASEPDADEEKPPDARLEFSPSDHQGPWELRVDALRYDPVDQDGLAILLKTGIWADALELQTQSGHWIPLSRHPVYPAVRQILLRQTQQIVAQVSTGDWARESAHPHVTTHALIAPTSDMPPARPAPDRTWKPSLIAVVIALLTGILCGLVGFGIYRHFRAPQNSANIAPIAPQEHPVLAVPMPSESDDMSGAIAMANARSRVARAHDAIRFSQGLLAAQKPKLARQVLLNAMLADDIRPDLKDAFNQAIAADPALHAPALTLGVDTPIQQISPLGGGRSISLKITLPDQQLASFKPAQEEWGQGWRAELAAYLFCEIVPCHFVSPKNRAARISRAHFEAYYAGGQRDWRASYAERFEAIHWVREAGPDGVVRDYMYGTLEEWIPHFVEWPIEYTEVYQDLLDIRFNPDDLNIPYAELLTPFETLAGGRFHASLLADQGDATVRDIAAQISSLLVFDFLTQNWDRFSNTEKYYGVNNQFAQGKFISIDNGAAFYDEDVTKLVGPRFELTSRFSRSMVTAIRALDPAVVNEVFFANPNLNARRRLQLFWHQRAQLLQRVDALIERYGSDRVYEFD